MPAFKPNRNDACQRWQLQYSYRRVQSLDALLRANSEINAVVHAHPTYLSAAGVSGEAPDADLLFETRDNVGEIVLIPAAEPGSQEYADLVVSKMGNATVGILSKHGAVAVGSTIEEAQFRLERAEHLAHIVLVSR